MSGKKPVVYKKYKAKPVKMWHSDYMKNCAECRYLKRIEGRDFWIINDEVWANVPLERRPVIVYCGLTGQKCAKIPAWDNE